MPSMIESIDKYQDMRVKRARQLMLELEMAETALRMQYVGKFKPAPRTSESSHLVQSAAK